jgi:hypothetical protein
VRGASLPIPLARYQLMERALPYAISAGIVGFGVWILVAGFGSGATIFWACMASMPIAVGLLSAVGELLDG